MINWITISVDIQMPFQYHYIDSSALMKDDGNPELVRAYIYLLAFNVHSELNKLYATL
jgi:hypothetical protein